MVELLRTNDVVLLSFLEALLRDAGIEPVLLDAHVSVMEGSIGVFPRRLMTLAEDAERARALLKEAGVEPSKLPR